MLSWVCRCVGTQVCWVCRCVESGGVLGTEVYWVHSCVKYGVVLESEVCWVCSCVGCIAVLGEGAFLLTCTAQSEDLCSSEKPGIFFLFRDRGKQSKGKPSPRAFF